MKKEKYSQEYIERANKTIWEILNDEAEYDDWTQICFSMQDAVQAAANIWGCSTDEEIHQLAKFIQELVVQEIMNINKFDVTFKKK